MLAAAMGSPAVAIEEGTYPPSILEWSLVKAEHEIFMIVKDEESRSRARVVATADFFKDREVLTLLVIHFEDDPKHEIDAFISKIKAVIQRKLKTTVVNLITRGHGKTIPHDIVFWVDRYDKTPKDQRVSVGLPYVVDLKSVPLPQKYKEEEAAPLSGAAPPDF